MAAKTSDKQTILNMEYFRVNSMLQVFKKLVSKQQQIINDDVILRLQADIVEKVSVFDVKQEIGRFVQEMLSIHFS